MSGSSDATQTAGANASGTGGLFGSAGSSAATAGSLFNIAQGLRSGTPTGQAQAAIGSAQLANKAGAFGSQSANAGAGLGIAGGALGIYNGIKQGGVAGYGGAAVGALQAGSGIASLANNSTWATGLGSAAGYVAAPLAVYNAVANYKSGATGSDALNGAEAGAAVGSIIPGIGTVIGGVIGGAVGALSSAFGPGAKDAETAGVQNIINATSQNGNSSQVAQSVSNPYIGLAGLFDERSSTLPMYQEYGRMGESKFTNGMINQINQAYQAGTINKNSTPQQVYSAVVAPWVNSMGSGYSNVGSTYTATTQGLVQNMVEQYMNGSYKTAWQSVGGQQIAANAPAYGSNVMATTNGTVINPGSAFPGGSSDSSGSSSAATPNYMSSIGNINFTGRQRQ
jgi:hypothetical protein